MGARLVVMALLPALLAVCSIFVLFFGLAGLYRWSKRVRGHKLVSVHASTKSNGNTTAKAQVSHRTLVLFGSQTGTSEGFAQELVQEINVRFSSSTAAEARDLDGFELEVLEGWTMSLG